MFRFSLLKVDLNQHHSGVSMTVLSFPEWKRVKNCPSQRAAEVCGVWWNGILWHASFADCLILSLFFSSQFFCGEVPFLHAHHDFFVGALIPKKAIHCKNGLSIFFFQAFHTVCVRQTGPVRMGGCGFGSFAGQRGVRHVVFVSRWISSSNWCWDKVEIHCHWSHLQKGTRTLLAQLRNTLTDLLHETVQREPTACFACVSTDPEAFQQRQESENLVGNHVPADTASARFAGCAWEHGESAGHPCGRRLWNRAAQFDISLDRSFDQRRNSSSRVLVCWNLCWTSNQNLPGTRTQSWNPQNLCGLSFLDWRDWRIWESPLPIFPVNCSRASWKWGVKDSRFSMRSSKGWWCALLSLVSEIIPLKSSQFFSAVVQYCRMWKCWRGRMSWQQRWKPYGEENWALSWRSTQWVLWRTWCFTSHHSL